MCFWWSLLLVFSAHPSPQAHFSGLLDRICCHPQGFSWFVPSPFSDVAVVAASVWPLIFSSGPQISVLWGLCLLIFHLKDFPRHLGLVHSRWHFSVARMFVHFDFVIGEPWSLFLSEAFGKVCAWWHLGGRNKAMVHTEEGVQSSLVDLGKVDYQFVDNPDWCCFFTKLIHVRQVSALEIKLLEDNDKISMMPIPGDAWLGSGRGVWWCSNT